MIAYRYDKDKKYVGTQNCQRDPIASARAGKDIFLLPANCTYTKPPELKDGYELYYKNEVWEYVEIKKDDEPSETPEPTCEERISQLTGSFESARNRIHHDYLDAVIEGDVDAQKELQQELADLRADYATDMTSLISEGGE